MGAETGFQWSGDALGLGTELAYQPIAGWKGFQIAAS
jgi:hypothetical protein